METISLDFNPQRVRLIRALLGETQRQFAERIGVDRMTVINWEGSGPPPKRGPNLKALLDAEREATGA